MDDEISFTRFIALASVLSMIHSYSYDADIMNVFTFSHTKLEAVAAHNDHMVAHSAYNFVQQPNSLFHTENIHLDLVSQANE